MKKSKYFQMVAITVYIVLVLGIYISLVYPASVGPKGLVKTKIPSLSVSGLKEVDELFSSFGKEWVGYPSKPDLSKFIFGQKDPI